MTTLADNMTELRHLVKTDPDPRVRHRAQGLLMLAQGASVLSVARWFRTAPHRVRVWRTWFLEGGRDRLADDRRTGRPPKLGPADLTFLDEALQHGPQAYGWPVTTWSIRDLQELLRQERHVEVSVYTVYRAVRGLGYRYRRPRHDLKHRQDAEAVASAQEALAWLGKGPAPTPTLSTWCISTSAKSTGTRT
jgi:transposase